MASNRFQFSIVRYVPNPIRGEFVNVGIILHDIDKNLTYTKFTPDFYRIRAIDPSANTASLKLVLDMVQETLHKQVISHPIGDLSELLGGLLSLSPVRGGFTFKNLEVELESLFSRYIYFDNDAYVNRLEARIKHQSRLFYQVREHFLRSECEILHRMNRVIVDERLKVSFDFAGKQQDRVIVVQPISLIGGNHKYKTDVAKKFVANATVAKSSTIFSRAQFFAIVQSNAQNEEVEAAKSTLEYGYNDLLDYDDNGTYINQLISAVG